MVGGSRCFGLRMGLLGSSGVTNVVLRLKTTGTLKICIVLLLRLHAGSGCRTSYEPLPLGTLTGHCSISISLVKEVLHRFSLFRISRRHRVFHTPCLSEIVGALRRG